MRISGHRLHYFGHRVRYRDATLRSVDFLRWWDPGGCRARSTHSFGTWRRFDAPMSALRPNDGMGNALKAPLFLERLRDGERTIGGDANLHTDTDRRQGKNSLVRVAGQSHPPRCPERPLHNVHQPSKHERPVRIVEPPGIVARRGTVPDPLLSLGETGSGLRNRGKPPFGFGLPTATTPRYRPFRRARSVRRTMLSCPRVGTMVFREPYSAGLW